LRSSVRFCLVVRVDVDQSLKSETNLNVGTTPSDETRTAYTYDGFDP